MDQPHSVASDQSVKFPGKSGEFTIATISEYRITISLHADLVLSATQLSATGLPPSADLGALSYVTNRDKSILTRCNGAMTHNTTLAKGTRPAQA